MILDFLSLLSAPAPRVTERVEAPPPSVAESTGGMIRDASRLDVDPEALLEEPERKPQLAGRRHGVEEAVEDLIARLRDVLAPRIESAEPRVPAAEAHPVRPGT